MTFEHELILVIKEHEFHVFVTDLNLTMNRYHVELQ